MAESSFYHYEYALQPLFAEFPAAPGWGGAHADYRVPIGSESATAVIRPPYAGMEYNPDNNQYNLLRLVRPWLAEHVNARGYGFWRYYVSSGASKYKTVKKVGIVQMIGHVHGPVLQNKNAKGQSGRWKGFCTERFNPAWKFANAKVLSGIKFTDLSLAGYYSGQAVMKPVDFIFHLRSHIESYLYTPEFISQTNRADWFAILAGWQDDANEMVGRDSMLGINKVSIPADPGIDNFPTGIEPVRNLELRSQIQSQTKRLSEKYGIFFRKFLEYAKDRQ